MAEAKYTLLQHRHNFAAWSAARAVQRGLAGAGTGRLIKALETIGAPDFLLGDLARSKTAESYNEFHRDKCRAISKYLQRAGVETTYGRAAKLLGIYLKSMVVCGSAADTLVCRHIHPPIDRVLLGSIAKDSPISEAHRQLCPSTNWTGLKKDAYFRLVELLLQLIPGDAGFWTLESHWELARKNSLSIDDS